MKALKLKQHLVVVDTETKIFEADGSFINSDDVLLLLNTIQMIINSYPELTIQTKTLQLELLRCGIHVINEQIEAILLRMISEGSIKASQGTGRSMN